MARILLPSMKYARRMASRSSALIIPLIPFSKKGFPCMIAEYAQVDPFSIIKIHPDGSISVYQRHIREMDETPLL